VEEKENQYSDLKKFFENEGSQDEAESVIKWLQDPDSNYRFENCLHNLWKEFEPESVDETPDLDATLDRIHHVINIHSKPEFKSLVQKASFGKKVNHFIKNLGRVAAILLVPLLIYTGWEYYHQRKWMATQTEVQYNEIICPLGAQSRFELPDGTTGNLNNGSRLRYPVKFSGKTREVELYGEAFFDVKSMKSNPFVINTTGLDIKVLGTRLNVYSYPEEDYQEITLESGSIELFKKEQDGETLIVEMKPGQHLVYKFERSDSSSGFGKSEGNLIINDSKEELDEVVKEMAPGKQTIFNTDNGRVYLKYDDVEQYTGWTNGKLILRNDPMPKLLKRMERWYSVKFKIMDDGITDYTYWATFEEENLDQVLRLLSLTGPIKFTKLPREKKDDGTYKTQEIQVTLK